MEQVDAVKEQEGRRPSLHVVAAAAVVAAVLARFAWLALAIPFQYNDWIWLRRAGSLAQLSRDTLGSEALRGFSLVAFTLSRRLFGVDPRPLAALFVGVQLASIALAIRVFQRLGLPTRTAVIAAVAGFFTASTYACFESLTTSEAAQGRLAVLAVLFVFLGREAPRARRWVPVAVGAFLTHEIVTITPLLLFACLWYRDGWAGARRFFRGRVGITFVALMGALLAARAALFFSVAHVTHALGTSRIGDNLAASAGLLLREWSPRLEEIGGWLLALSALWAWRRGLLPKVGALGRALAFAAAWTVIAYLPFLPATSYFNGYFLATAQLGPALALALALTPATRFLDRLARADGFGRLLSLLAAVGLALTVIRAEDTLFNPSWRQDGMAAIQARVAATTASPSGVTPVIFTLSERAEAASRPGSYMAFIASDGRSSAMLDVLYPDRLFRVVELGARHLPYLCGGAGDVVIAVDIERWGILFVPRRPCDGVPPGLVEASSDSNVEPERAAFFAAARGYWEARRRGAAEEALARLAEMVERRRRGVPGIAKETADAIVEAAAVTRPCAAGEEAERCAEAFIR